MLILEKSITQGHLDFPFLKFSLFLYALLERKEWENRGLVCSVIAEL
jgi:hypothetical protein